MSEKKKELKFYGEGFKEIIEKGLKLGTMRPSGRYDFEKGEEVNLNIDEIDFGQIEDNVKICTNCGYTTEEDFIYCPKCSNKL